MQMERLKAVGVSAIIIMAVVASLHSGLSLLMETVTIHCSGSIGSVRPTISNYTVADNSEIRALFVHSASFGGANWELITQTAKDYNINTLLVEMLANYLAFYPSAYIPNSGIDILSTILASAHARDIKVHVLMDVQLGSLGPEYQCERSDGSKFNWLCPTKAVSRTLLKNLVEELVTNYDIDGFMFDYVRYEMVDSAGATCYCPECKAKLQADIDETIVDWSEFAPGGSRYNEFMEWRVKPITELVRDMRNWMLAIKPDLEFSGAVWAWWPEIPTTNRWRLGQDWVEWIKEGYLDWVAPMLYMTDIDLIGQIVQAFHLGLGGAEGKIPLAVFLTNAFPSAVDPTNFKQQIDTVRANGADGWVIWRYGGPGDGSGAPDIRQYLDLIDLYPRFSIENINASPGASSCTVSWTTDLPASSEVEYSTSPLFTASFNLLPATTTPEGMPIPDFHYWDIDHVLGTTMEYSTPVTNHSVTLTNLQEETQYYFRVQSEDQYGTATSKVYNFTTDA